MMSNNTQNYIKEADGIRGLACLSVLIVHAIAITFPATYPYFYGTGKIGVWLFFTLSSFLLTYQLILRGFSKKVLIDYFISRVLRIYPIFVLIVLVYYYFGTADINTTTDLINAITFRAGYAHLWTIPVEFKFYFVLPAFAFVGNLIHVRYGRWGLLATGTVFTLIHQIFAPYWLLGPNTIDMFPYIPAFLFGVVAAIIKLNDTSSWMPNRGIFFGNGILIGILVSTPLMRYFILGMPPSGYLINKYLFISLVWTVFIYSQINSKSPLQSLLVSRPMTRLGMYSYSIYLIHWLILNKLASSYPEQAATIVAIIFLSILVGFLMYTYIEKPLLSARKYIQTKFNLKPNKTATNE